jgi:hypothetical protein
VVAPLTVGVQSWAAVPDKERKKWCQANYVIDKSLRSVSQVREPPLHKPIDQNPLVAQAERTCV